MKQPDLATIRTRLGRVIVTARDDGDFRALLRSDPEEALARFDLTLKEVQVDIAAQDRLLAIQPPGCADLTCIASECPGTCWVTIPEF